MEFEFLRSKCLKYTIINYYVCFYCSRSNAYSDEPENGEEVQEKGGYYSEDDEDTFKYKPTPQSPKTSKDTNGTIAATPPPTKSPTRQLDLGASANLGATKPTSPKSCSGNNDDFATFSDFSAPITSPQKSSMDELADILTPPLPEPSLLPVATGNTNNTNLDLFGDFSSPAPGIFSLHTILFSFGFCF